jgi:hypothetical protein
VEPLEGGEAQGWLTNGWHRVAPTTVLDDVIGSTVTTAEGCTDHAVASQREVA